MSGWGWRCWTNKHRILPTPYIPLHAAQEKPSRVKRLTNRRDVYNAKMNLSRVVWMRRLQNNRGVTRSCATRSRDIKMWPYFSSRWTAVSRVDLLQCLQGCHLSHIQCETLAIDAKNFAKQRGHGQRANRQDRACSFWYEKNLRQHRRMWIVHCNFKMHI